MKLKSFFALLAASCMAVSCTNEMAEVVNDDLPKENELRLLFTSSTNGEVYPTTKAIASEEENAIDNLTIYVFGASTETGTYYYIDKWTSAATQNDLRNMFRIDNWNTQPLWLNSAAYVTVYNSTAEKTVNNSYLNSFLPSSRWNYASYPYQACNSGYLYDYNESFANTYDYYWSADNMDATKARGIKLREYTYSRTTCSRRWNSTYNRYDYYTSNSRGNRASYLTYQQTSRSISTYKIRCVKRRPGNPVYPY